MIPKWKLERELNRIKEQILQLPWYVYGGPRKALHDLLLPRLLKVTDGQAPLSGNMAVVLIFQPAGILKSTLAQLEYLASHGFSTLVVSNAPLSADDRQRLIGLTYQVMERPNYGYDFGGYRDGILHLLKRGIRPDNLIVMNDSCWMPAQKSSDPVGVALRDQADLFGISYFEHARKQHLSHIQSYFFRFGPKITSDPYFQEFWQNIPVSSIRQTVIRKCEMRLTNAFQRRGHSVNFLFDDTTAIQHALQLADEELKDLILYLSRISERYAATFREVLERISTGSDWRPEAEHLMNSQPALIPFLVLHPNIMVGRCQTPVLKKDRSGLYKAQREEIRRLGYLSSLTPSVAEEVAYWDQQ